MSYDMSYELLFSVCSKTSLTPHPSTRLTGNLLDPQPKMPYWAGAQPNISVSCPVGVHFPLRQAPPSLAAISGLLWTLETFKLRKVPPVASDPLSCIQRQKLFNITPLLVKLLATKTVTTADEENGITSHR